MKRLVLAFSIVLSLSIVSCGEGGGGDSQLSSDWDAMQWDQGDWA